MTLSSKAAAEAVLRVAELAARNLDLDVEEEGAPSIEQVAFGRLVGKLSYLRSQALALWPAGFDSVLAGSHSMRITRVDQVKKNSIRGGCRCVACGRIESRCMYAVDLAGRFDAAAWCRDATGVNDLYSDFLEDFDTFSEESAEDCASKKKLFDGDHGSFMVGETCLRKTKLAFIIQTLLLDACCTSDLVLSESGEEATDEALGHTLTVTPERTEEFLLLLNQLEYAVADSRYVVPEMLVDTSLFGRIDRVRAAAAGGDRDVLNQLLRGRAALRLGRRSWRENGAEANEGGDGGHGQERGTKREEEHQRQHAEGSTRLGAQLTPCVATRTRASKRRLAEKEAGQAGQEDEQEDEQEHVRPRRAKRKRPVIISDDEEDEEEDDGEEEEEEMADDAQPAPSPPRRQAVDPSGIAGIARSEGVLGSRRGTLLAGMRLATRLQEAEQAGDAMVVSTLVLTIQDLLSRVGRAP